MSKLHRSHGGAICNYDLRGHDNGRHRQRHTLPSKVIGKPIQVAPLSGLGRVQPACHRLAAATRFPSRQPQPVPLVSGVAVLLAGEVCPCKKLVFASLSSMTKLTPQGIVH